MAPNGHVAVVDTFPIDLQGGYARPEFPNLLKNVVADRTRRELAGGL